MNSSYIGWHSFHYVSQTGAEVYYLWVFFFILQSKLEALIKATAAYKLESEALQELWNRVKDKMFSLHPREQTLGLREKVGL